MMGLLDAATYAYSYGMVSAMPQHLDKETYARILQSASVEMAIAELIKTQYEKQIKEAISKGGGENLEEIEKAVVSYYFDVCNAVINTLPMDVRDSSKTVLLDEFDIGNLKRILRALKSKGINGNEGKNTDEILAECIEGNIKVEILKEIANTDFKCATGKIKTLGFEVDGENLFDIENSLDINLIRKWAREAEKVKVIEKFVKKRIDTLNLKAIIRMKILGVDADNFIKKTTSGAYLNFEILNAINAAQINKENIDAIQGILAGTSYENLFAHVFEEFKKTKSIDMLELDIESTSASVAVIPNPISLEYVLTYLRKMWFDVRNIRVLLVGKKYGVNNEEINKMMVLM
ncbi:MAG: V-type ATPase subunit [Candidatus Altarchaeum sp.]|nr:V-type ATPase subunit [Candidatus Altarchaeum sp.]